MTKWVPATTIEDVDAGTAKGSDKTEVLAGLRGCRQIYDALRHQEWSLVKRGREVGLTFDEIGAALGRSRQRAQQILSEGFDKSFAAEVQHHLRRRPASS